MDIKEYLHRAKNDDNFTPGWEAIDKAFESVYQQQKPRHYATNLKTRANLGGDQYLDGYSIYVSPNSYFHIVTYGMSELYANEESFGGAWSGWGYEMTFKIAFSEQNLDSNGLEKIDSKNCLWALNTLSNLAYFTNTQNNHLENLQFIVGDGKSIDRITDSKITALIITYDTEIKSVNTLHGRLDFLQLVGITQKELEWIMQFQDMEENKKKIQELIYKMQDDNPYLVTDMSRTKDYV